jgi:hypothetical protein
MRLIYQNSKLQLKALKHEQQKFERLAFIQLYKIDMTNEFFDYFYFPLAIWI